jgi:ribonuclease PH
MLRSDARAPDQLRPVRIEPDFLPTAEGSALIEVGHTRVVCTATIEAGVPAFLRNMGKGWITSEYAMLPRATLTRTPRESARGRISGRTHEIQRLIGRALRAVVDLDQLGERTLWVDCDVIQADGGTRTASITGAYVALAMALQRMTDSKTLPRLPLRDSIAAVSVGIIDATPTLDLNYEEDSRAEVDMNVAMTGAGRYVELQATAEQRAFSDEQWQAMLKLARSGIQQLMRAQSEALAKLARATRT